MTTSADTKIIYAAIHFGAIRNSMVAYGNIKFIGFHGELLSLSAHTYTAQLQKRESLPESKLDQLLASLALNIIIKRN